MSHPAQPLADAFHWWSHPQVARLVRFPTRENRRRQLAAVGWLAVYLGAVQDGLRLVDASRPDPHVYSRLLRDTIEGLLVGNRRSADELDLELRAATRDRPRPTTSVRRREHAASVRSRMGAATRRTRCAPRGCWEGYALVDSARSWGWVLRTANGIRADLGHGITRLLPSGRIRDPDFAEGHPIWAEETFRYTNDAAVIGEGPGRLLLQSRYASPVTHPYPDDNPVWVLDVASGRMVRQAPTLWRFLRDR